MYHTNRMTELVIRSNNQNSSYDLNGSEVFIYYDNKYSDYIHDVTTAELPIISSMEEGYKIWQMTLIAHVCGIIIVCTVIGNALVCTAVAVTRKLRAPPSNLLIVSLAVADLLVALLDMPFAAVYEVKGRWMFGELMCDVWTSLDVFLCTASILNLCMISVDRYLVITRPFQYAMKRTPFRMLIMITTVWLMSAVISIPPLFYSRQTNSNASLDTSTFHTSTVNLNLSQEEGNQSGNESNLEQCILNQDIGYQLYATIGAFYIPLCVMIVIYTRIYLVSSRLARSDIKSKVSYVQPNSSSPYDLQALVDSRQMSLTPTAGSTTTLQREGVQTNGRTTVSGIFQSLPSRRSRGHSLGELIPRKIRSACINGHSRSGNGSVSERKATKTLGVIMGAFVICWLPFFVLALIKPFCSDPSTCIPGWLSALFLWLGFANSFLNPVIYARFNRDFRTPFKYILQCKCRTINSRMRNEEYTVQFGPLNDRRESTLTTGGTAAENLIQRPL